MATQVMQRGDTRLRLAFCTVHRLLRLGDGGTGDAEGRYKGVLDCFGKTLKNDGMGAFYNGFLPNVCSPLAV